MDFTRMRRVRQSAIDAIAGIPITQLEEPAWLINNCTGKVVTTGIGKAGLVARKMTSTLRSIGVAAEYLHPTEARHGDSGGISDRDLLVVFSNSGQTEEVLLMLHELRRLKPLEVIAITASRFSQIGRLGRCIEIGRIPEACPIGLCPTSSISAMLVVADMLCMHLAEERKLTREQFGKSHHGGYLGAQCNRK